MHRFVLLVATVVATLAACGHAPAPLEAGVSTAPSATCAGAEAPMGYPIWARQIPAWQPTDVSGLQGWYTGDDVETEQFAARVPDNSLLGRHLLSGFNAASPRITSGLLFGGTGLQMGNFGSSASAYLRADVSTTTDWRFLHSGSGATVVFLARPMSRTATAATGLDTHSALGPGLSITHDAVRARWTAVLHNASGAAGIIMTLDTPNGSAPVEEDYVVSFTYSERDAPKAVLRVNGKTLATGGPSGAPSQADPYGPLCLGRATSANINWLDGYLRSVVLYNRTLTPSELALVEGNLPRLQSTRTLLTVWPVGDSITSTTYEETIYLRSKSSRTHRINFVGTQYGGDVSWFPDRQHDGWVAHNIASIHTKVSGAKLDAQPSHILVIAGTNDMGLGADVPAAFYRFKQLLAMLRRERPTAMLLVGRPPRRLTGGVTETEAFSALIPPYVATLENAKYVHTDVANDSEISDGVHPTAAGYQTIGNTFATALGIP